MCSFFLCVCVPIKLYLQKARSGAIVFKFLLYFCFSFGVTCGHLYFFFIIWRLITLQYCSGFCHTLTWLSLGYTCIPHPDPPSHLPLHSIPLCMMCSFEVSPWPLRASGLETGVKIGRPAGSDGILDQCYHNRDGEKEVWDMSDKEWKAQANALAV